jgi:AcrR family transcriptional regulator
MGRPPAIERSALLEIARGVFADRGMRATTAEVAQRAGISEGALFKRFKTKAELFRAAVEHMGEAPAWIAALPERVGRGPLDEELESLALEMLQFARTLMPCVLMAHALNGDGDLPVWQGEVPPPVRALKALAAYFEAETKLGRLRAGDPEVYARTFVGPLMHFVVLDLMHHSRDFLPIATETFVRGHVRVVLRGIEST